MASVPAATQPAKGTAYVGGNALVDQPKEPGSVFPPPPTGAPLSDVPVTIGDVLGPSTAVTPAQDDAAPYVWLKMEKDGSWKPMWKKDSLALEDAVAKGLKTLLVEGGRYMVDMEARDMAPVYWKGDKRRVLRSLWFWRQQGPLPGIGPATWMPYEDKDNLTIESLYLSLCSEGPSAKTKEAPLSDGTHKVVATLRTGSDDKDKDKDKDEPAKGEGSTSAADASWPSKPNTTTTSSSTGTSLSTGVSVSEAGSKWDLVQTRINYGIGVLHNRALRRGYGPYVVEGEAEEEGREVDHLVLVVHGIGEKLFANDDFQGMPSLKVAVDTMRKNTLAQQIARMEGGGPQAVAEETLSSSRGGAVLGNSQRCGKDKDSDKDNRGSLDGSTVPGPWIGKRIEFIPVEWFHSVRQDEGELTRRIKSVSLPSVPLFRQFANDAVMDVLLYMNPAFRQRIITCVGETIVREVQRYKDNNPSFKGHVSLIGHSLGSVILFDLMAHQRGLSSDPIVTPLDPAIDYPQLSPLRLHTLMLMGSPLGMFLTLREAQLAPSFRLPLVDNFLNLFHPHDPVAYRLEPLLLPALASLEPSLVACHGPSGTNIVTRIRDQQKALSTLGSSWSSAFHGLVSYVTPQSAQTAAAAALTGEPKPEEADVSELGLNRGRRVDYSLQEGVIETANEYLSAMSSHSSYFGSLDVALFLAKTLRDIQSVTTNIDNSAVASV